MSFIREINRKNKDGTVATYYAEVESYRINGKVRQRHLRSLGKDRDNPDSFPLDVMHFGYIATRLMQGDLSTDELFDMIESMGHRLNRENLERVGLFYNFKKNYFSLSLYRKRPSRNRKDVKHVEKD
ncbi:MAG: hypothetical protein ACYCSA_06745 [Thermoplasmataceae archaeon]